MVAVNGFTVSLLLDNVKQDLSRFSFQSPLHINFLISSPVRAGMTWTLAWKDEREERGETVGSIWLREHGDEGSRIVCSAVRLRLEDVAWPVVQGQFTSDRPAVELRLVISTVKPSGEVSHDPVAIFSCTISAAINRLPLLAPSAGQSGLQTTPALDPSPSAHISAPQKLPRAGPTSSTLAVHQSHPQATSPTPAQVAIALAQARQTEYELEKKLRREQTSAAFYEEAVETLYARLTPRQLVPYLDYRLATEALSPPMRVSVALAKAQALDRMMRDDQVEVEQEVVKMLQSMRLTAWEGLPNQEA